MLTVGCVLYEITAQPALGAMVMCIKLGWDDFSSMPSHAIFLCVIYPVAGIVLAQLILGYAILPLLFPLAAGFALIGPFAALGLYELSRRREAGQWLAGLEFVRDDRMALVEQFVAELTARQIELPWPRLGR